MVAPNPPASRRALAARCLTAGLLVALAALLARAAGAPAAVSTFGSPLSRPATLNTTDNLSYYGTFTPVPPNPEAPNGLFHTPHWGADAAIWNAALAGGQATAPADGQALKIRLEGCAPPATKGPPPLAQIHFQALSPLPGGGAKVKLTSQAFDLPVCGQHGASRSSVSTYEPVNLCLSKGDYVSFNDEGGYVPFVYRAGVPYQVIGSSPGSTMDSFIRSHGTGDGAVLSAGDRSANDGFASNPSEELMLQVVLGTGPDARYVCPGGTAQKPPTLRPAKVVGQTYHVSRSRVVQLGIYCRAMSGCKGQATIGVAGDASVFGQAKLDLRGNHTSTVPVRVAPALVSMIHRRHSVPAVVNLQVGGATVSQTVTMKTF
jgi:hypothetical protein